MNRLNKTVTVTIDPTFAWTDWELPESKLAPVVARLLNLRLKELVNLYEDRDLVEDEMLDLMNEYASDGAYDSEPQRFLSRVLDEIYGS